jgi:uncharacterized protein (TIGR03382 family)
MNRESVRRARAWLFVVWLTTGCGGDGIASCTDPEAFNPTPAENVERGVTAVVTEAGVDFVLQRREQLLSQLLEVDAEGYAVFEVPELDAGDEDLGAGVRDLVVAVDVRGASPSLFVLDDPARVRLTLDDAKVQVRRGVVWLSTGNAAACQIRNGLFPGTRDASVLSMDLVVDVELAVDEAGQFAGAVTLSPPTINGFGIVLERDDALPECQENPDGCDRWCGLNDNARDLSAAIEGILTERFDEWLLPPLQDAIDDALEPIRMQPLVVAGRLDLSTLTILFGGVDTFPDTTPIFLRVGPGPEPFDVVPSPGASLQLAVDTAFAADPHPCAAGSRNEPFFEAAELPTLDGRAGGVYHLAAAVSEASAKRAIWTAYASGLLCLVLDAERTARLAGLELTPALLEGLLPGLSAIAGPDATVRLVLEPLVDPAVDFVRFAPRGDAGGIPQAAIELSFAEFGISLYTRADDQWVRVYGVATELDVQLVAQATPDDRILFAIAPPTLGPLTATYDEPLPEADLAGLLSLGVELAGAVLGGEGFELPLELDGLLSEATGLPIDAQIDRLSVESGHLAALVTLVDRPAGGAAAASVQTHAELLARAPGTAVLRVEASAPSLYQWRVDGGPWRPLGRASDGVLRVADPLLSLAGPHQVRVRAVAEGDYRTLDPTPVAVHVPALAAPPPESSGGDGCDASGAGPEGAPVLGLLLLLGLGRRRRAPALGCGLLLVAVLVGCDDGVAGADATETCGTSGDCCPGAVCEAGECVARPAGCADDAACGDAAMQCRDGLCVRARCGAGCPDGTECGGEFCYAGLPCDGGCAAGEACLVETNECRTRFGEAEACRDGEVGYLVTEAVGPACGAGRTACEGLVSLSSADYGRFATLVGVSGDAARFVAYEPALGDLVDVEVSIADGTLRRLDFVDGVPDSGTPVGNPAGPRRGLAEPGPDRGRRVRAIAASDGVHAVYLDEAGNLRHDNLDDDTAPTVIGPAADVRPAITAGGAGVFFAWGAPDGVYIAQGPGFAPRRIAEGEPRLLCMGTGLGGTPMVAWVDAEGALRFGIEGNASFLVSTAERALANGFPDAESSRYATLAEHELGPGCAVLAPTDGAVVIAIPDATTGALLAWVGGEDGVGGFEMIDAGRPGRRRVLGPEPVALPGVTGVLYADLTDNDLFLTTRGLDGWRPDPLLVLADGAIGLHPSVFDAGTPNEVLAGTLQLRTTARGEAAHRLRVIPAAIPRSR